MLEIVKNALAVLFNQKRHVGGGETDPFANAGYQMKLVVYYEVLAGKDEAVRAAEITVEPYIAAGIGPAWDKAV